MKRNRFELLSILRTEELVQKGLRFVYRENNNTLSRDLEPEYITLNEEETMAYVCLQVS